MQINLKKTMTAESLVKTTEALSFPHKIFRCSITDFSVAQHVLSTYLEMQHVVFFCLT